MKVTEHTHPDLSKGERDLLRRRVTRGAAALDAERPGWEAKVTRDLDMHDVGRCVLGQVFCGYMQGLIDLGHPINKHTLKGQRFAISHGFEISDKDCLGYTDLGIAWENLLEERRYVGRGIGPWKAP